MMQMRIVSHAAALHTTSQRSENASSSYTSAEVTDRLPTWQPTACCRARATTIVWITSALLCTQSPTHAQCYHCTCPWSHGLSLQQACSKLAAGLPVKWQCSSATKWLLQHSQITISGSVTSTWVIWRHKWMVAGEDLQLPNISAVQLPHTDPTAHYRRTRAIRCCNNTPSQRGPCFATAEEPTPPCSRPTGLHTQAFGPPSCPM